MIWSYLLSYRRVALRVIHAIYDQLAERFTEERIFMDVDAIRAGSSFDGVINQAVGHFARYLRDDW